MLLDGKELADIEPQDQKLKTGCMVTNINTAVTTIVEGYHQSVLMFSKG